MAGVVAWAYFIGVASGILATLAAIRLKRRYFGDDGIRRRRGDFH